MIHEIKAIIRASRLNRVMENLHRIPRLPGITVSRVHAYGRRRTDGGVAASADVEADFMKLEIVVPVSLSERVVDAIREAAHTGGAGDGMIFVIDVLGAVRIRNGARDVEALNTEPSPP